MSDALVLREMTEDDLPVLFEYQLQPAARHMAAFTPKAATGRRPRDRGRGRWARRGRGGLHIPAFPYEILWGERSIRSVANLTRADGREFLAVDP